MISRVFTIFTLLCLYACGIDCPVADQYLPTNELSKKLQIERSLATTTSRYIIMRDAVRLAIDLHLPTVRKPKENTPSYYLVENKTSERKLHAVQQEAESPIEI